MAGAWGGRRLNKNARSCVLYVRYVLGGMRRQVGGWEGGLPVSKAATMPSWPPRTAVPFLAAESYTWMVLLRDGREGGGPSGHGGASGSGQAPEAAAGHVGTSAEELRRRYKALVTDGTVAQVRVCALHFGWATGGRVCVGGGDHSCELHVCLPDAAWGDT